MIELPETLIMELSPLLQELHALNPDFDFIAANIGLRDGDEYDVEISELMDTIFKELYFSIGWNEDVIARLMENEEIIVDLIVYAAHDKAVGSVPDKEQNRAMQACITALQIAMLPIIKTIWEAEFNTKPS